MSNIKIAEENRALINRLIPRLHIAYDQIKTYTEQTETALTDASIDPSLWVTYPAILKMTGYNSVVYYQLDFEISWNVADAVWELSKLVETKQSTEDKLQ